ncbi:MAG: acyl--CoA ligase [Alphaproteobacteria bacterium]|nr:acyl--CoA ligase [Alphaproteobacteria bacterium]MBU1513095.1 acyl--CoA ligase [Alphaproteobacteria bacterium]MBU2095203.1 acyl--CoA ligase [Alphaproteobacteria bacterium]MBU2150638.1 acyl--CoA ligase [Alphaproteobacteria bacterium]MBU2306103.1 acyl--CoA ligase [Alphaproteobacteria bacterium]
MRPSPPERVAEYRRKGWWRGETVDSVFRKAVAARGDAEALVDAPNRQALIGSAQQRLTFAEVDRAADAMSHAFNRLGVGPGDVVATQLPNVVEGVIAFLACARMGAILSPVATAYRAHELRQILPSVTPRVYLTTGLFHGCDHAAMLRDLQRDGVTDAQVVSLDATAPDGVHLLSELTAAAPATAFAAPADQDACEALTLCWTSGTEAVPKGVPRHHDHWVVNGEALVEAAGLRPGDAILNPFPLINIASIGGMVMPWLLCQGRLIQHQPFDLPIFLGQMQDEQVAYTVAPPAVLNMLLNNDALLSATDLSHLRCLGSGSAPLAPWMVKGWQDKHGVTVMNVFGSNEGTSLFSTGEAIPDPEQRARFFPRFGAAGIDWPAVFPSKIRTRLVDPETEQEITAPGAEGELRIDGAMTFDGYWQAPDLTATAFDAQGFFRTGDLFEITPEGGGRYYRFVGRCKEIIIRGGQNISPAEVDVLIESHPKVREASCAAYPDERLGERVCAVVALRPDQTLNLDELIAHLKAQDVATYKLPEKLRVVEALPRNPLGKVLRRELSGVAAS